MIEPARGIDHDPARELPGTTRAVQPLYVGQGTGDLRQLTAVRRPLGAPPNHVASRHTLTRYAAPLIRHS